MRHERTIPEYDIHAGGARVDDTLESFGRLVAQARSGGPRLFAVVTGYGSSGGTSRILSAVLAACRRYRAENHIRGYLAGERAGDVFSAEFQAFPDASLIPSIYKRSPNPGIVFVCV